MQSSKRRSRWVGVGGVAVVALVALVVGGLGAAGVLAVSPSRAARVSRLVQVAGGRSLDHVSAGPSVSRLAGGGRSPSALASSASSRASSGSSSGAFSSGAFSSGAFSSGASAPGVRLVPPPHPEPPAAQLLAGVGPLPSGWRASVHTVRISDMPRTYLTIRPAALTSRVPLVVLLHGRNMTPDGVLHISGLARQIGPAVLVVPAGWGRMWNAGDCCGLAYLRGVPDVAFVRAVVEDVLAANPEASAKEVYAVGFSNGGRMAYRLACDLPGMFKGFMAVEAVPVEACSSMRSLNITIVAQQSDPLLTVDEDARPKSVGGFVEPTVEATLAHIEHLDHCAGPGSAARHGLSIERTWACGGGTVLRYVWYPGGGHTWRPATSATPGATDYARQLLGRPDGRVGGQVPPAPPQSPAAGRPA